MKLIIAWIKKLLGIQSPSIFGYKYEYDYLTAKTCLMGNHKVPQLVQALDWKTKTGRHFPQIIEVLEQIKGEADGK